MKKCKHQNCAVCRDIKYRDIFEYILNKKNPEVYICPHATYAVTNYKGEESELNLDRVCKGNNGYYTIDPFRGQFIYLNQTNFMVKCNLDECEATPYVKTDLP